MTPVQPTQPARPFHRAGWVYEEKIDGWRVLAHKDGGQVRLISRHAKDLTSRFPELAEAIANLRPETLVLEQAAGPGAGTPVTPVASRRRARGVLAELARTRAVTTKAPCGSGRSVPL